MPSLFVIYLMVVEKIFENRYYIFAISLLSPLEQRMFGWIGQVVLEQKTKMRTVYKDVDNNNTNENDPIYKCTTGHVKFVFTPTQ